jgi:hypothetical protein
MGKNGSKNVLPVSIPPASKLLYRGQDAALIALVVPRRARVLFRRIFSRFPCSTGFLGAEFTFRLSGRATKRFVQPTKGDNFVRHARRFVRFFAAMISTRSRPLA